MHPHEYVLVMQLRCFHQVLSRWTGALWVCTTMISQLTRTQKYRYLQSDSSIFTSFLKFTVFVRNMKSCFIFNWLGRALSPLSNDIVFIWFIAYLDINVNEFREAHKKTFVFGEICICFSWIIRAIITYWAKKHFKIMYSSIENSFFHQSICFLTDLFTRVTENILNY